MVYLNNEKSDLFTFFRVNKRESMSTCSVLAAAVSGKLAQAFLLLFDETARWIGNK